LHGFETYSSIFDGDKTDWLVQVPETGKILKNSSSLRQRRKPSWFAEHIANLR